MPAALPPRVALSGTDHNRHVVHGCESKIMIQGCANDGSRSDDRTSQTGEIGTQASDNRMSMTCRAHSNTPVIAMSLPLPMLRPGAIKESRGFPRTARPAADDCPGGGSPALDTSGHAHPLALGRASPFVVASPT